MYTNEEKNKIRERIDARFRDLTSQLQEAVKAQNEYRRQVEGLEKATGTYTRSEIETRKQKASGEHVLRNKPLYKKLQDNLEGLNSDLSALHSQLDLNDPRLVNALSVIEKGGAVSFEGARAIAEPFKRDQQALRILSGAFHSHGYNEGVAVVSKMLYDPAAAMKRILGIASSFGGSPDTAINKLSSEIAKIAKMEGQTFEALPDRDGMNFTDAVREKMGI